MFGIVLDKGGPLPLSRQLCDALRSLALAGTLPAHARLPSTREAAKDLGVSRNVVVESYEQLEAEGFLRGGVGAGTFVTEIGAARAARSASSRQTAIFPRRDAGAEAANRAAARVDFASACGVPDLASFPFARWRACVATALDDAPESAFSFGDVRGDPGYRLFLSQWLFRTKGIACGPERVFATSGIGDAFALAARFLRPRSAAAVFEDPCYRPLKRTARSLGYRIEAAPADASGLVVYAIPPSSGDRRLFVAAPSHQFPLGGLLPIERRLALLDRAASERSWVFEDDYDGDVRLRGLPVPPLATLDADRVFYAGTFNKSLFPSLRLGYLVVPPDLAEPLRVFREGDAAWTDLPVQRALRLFAEEGALDRRLRALRASYAARRAFLEAEVPRALGAVVHGAYAGAHCRLELPPGPLPRLPFDEASASRAGFLLPRVRRCLPGPADRRPDVVLGYGNLSTEELGAGLAAFAALLEA